MNSTSHCLQSNSIQLVMGKFCGTMLSAKGVAHCTHPDPVCLFCRFGVSQRAALQDKASPVPHLLCLGATPIPRTLELMQTGHLTSYAIKELPPGRQSVVTLILPDTPLDVGKVCFGLEGVEGKQFLFRLLKPAPTLQENPK